MSEREEKPKRKGDDVLSLLVGLGIGSLGTTSLFFLYKLVSGVNN